MNRELVSGNRWVSQMMGRNLGAANHVWMDQIKPLFGYDLATIGEK